VQVKLLARQQLGEVRANSQVEIGLLEVVDAVRQSGSIALQVTGEASVEWFEGEGVVRVDTWPPEVPRENTVAGFEYSQQPCSLKLKVLPEETWISVEPQYLVQVGADVVQLRAQLSYNIRGPKTDGVEVSLDGWQLDAVEPAASCRLGRVQLCLDRGNLVAQQQAPFLQAAQHQLVFGVFDTGLVDQAVEVCVRHPQLDQVTRQRMQVVIVHRGATLSRVVHECRSAKRL